MCSGIITPDHESGDVGSSPGSCVYCCVALYKAFRLAESVFAHLHNGDSDSPLSSFQGVEIKPEGVLKSLYCLMRRY